MTKTKLYVSAAAAAVAVAAAAFVVVARGDATVRAGALLVEPPSVTIAADQERAVLELTNDGGKNVGFTLSSDEPWLAMGTAAGVVSAGTSSEVELLADRAGLPAGTLEATVEVATVDGSATIPVTLVVGEGFGASGPARLEASPSLRFEASATATELRITNGGAEPLSWEATPADGFVVLEQLDGEIPGGEAAVVRVTVDRSGLETGLTRSRIVVTSNGGDATVAVEIRTERIPLLVVPQPALDFGSAREGVGTLTLDLRNGGLAPLTYQFSIARSWVRVEGAGTGTIRPGEGAEVQVSYVFDRAPEGVHELTLSISSDGGDAIVAVRGVHDTVAPYASDRRMSIARERCEGGSCTLHRTASATVIDATDITEIHLRYRFCSEGPQSDITCGDFVFVPMRRQAGDTFTAETEALAACSLGRGSYLLWQIYTEDSLGNVRLLPGSKTPEHRRHCRRDGTLA